MSATLVVRDAISMCIALLKWSRRCTRKYRGTWNKARPIALLGLARRERISNKPSRCKICVAFPPQMEPRLDGKFQRTRNRFGKQGNGRGFGSGPESKFDTQDSESVRHSQGWSLKTLRQIEESLAQVKGGQLLVDTCVCSRVEAML